MCEIRQPLVMDQHSGGECGYYALASIITAIRHFRKEGLDRAKYKEVLEPALVDNRALFDDVFACGKSILLAEHKNHPDNFFWDPEFISSGEFFPELALFLLNNKEFMSAYGLEAGADVSLIDSDLLGCAEYSGHSEPTREALCWISETFAKSPARSTPLVHGFLTGVVNHWDGMVLAKEGDDSLLVFFDSMNWRVVEPPLPDDYYEAGNRKFEGLVAAGRGKPTQRLYVVKTFLVRTKYIKEE